MAPGQDCWTFPVSDQVFWWMLCCGSVLLLAAPAIGFCQYNLPSEVAVSNDCKCPYTWKANINGEVSKDGNLTISFIGALCECGFKEYVIELYIDEEHGGSSYSTYVKFIRKQQLSSQLINITTNKFYYNECQNKPSTMVTVLVRPMPYEECCKNCDGRCDGLETDTCLKTNFTLNACTSTPNESTRKQTEPVNESKKPMNSSKDIHEGHVQNNNKTSPLNNSQRPVDQISNSSSTSQPVANFKNVSLSQNVSSFTQMPNPQPPPVSSSLITRSTQTVKMASSEETIVTSETKVTSTPIQGSTTTSMPNKTPLKDTYQAASIIGILLTSFISIMLMLIICLSAVLWWKRMIQKINPGQGPETTQNTANNPDQEKQGDNTTEVSTISIIKEENLKQKQPIKGQGPATTQKEANNPEKEKQGDNRTEVSIIPIIKEEDMKKIQPIKVDITASHKLLDHIPKKRVYIAYSDDHDKHKRVVSCLATFLYKLCNCEVLLDEWFLNQMKQDILNWVLNGVNDADKCIIVTSQGAYYKNLAQLKGGKVQLPLEKPKGDVFSLALNKIKKEYYGDNGCHKFIQVSFPYNEKSISGHDFTLTDICTGCPVILMNHIEDLVMNIHGLQPSSPGQDNSLSGINMKEYTNFPEGKALNTAIKEMVNMVRENPNWYEEKLTKEQVMLPQEDSGVGLNFNLSMTSTCGSLTPESSGEMICSTDLSLNTNMSIPTERNPFFFPKEELPESDIVQTGNITPPKQGNQTFVSLQEQSSLLKEEDLPPDTEWAQSDPKTTETNAQSVPVASKNPTSNTELPPYKEMGPLIIPSYPRIRSSDKNFRPVVSPDEISISSLTDEDKIYILDELSPGQILNGGFIRNPLAVQCRDSEYECSV